MISQTLRYLFPQFNLLSSQSVYKVRSSSHHIRLGASSIATYSMCKNNLHRFKQYLSVLNEIHRFVQTRTYIILYKTRAVTIKITMAEMVIKILTMMTIIIMTMTLKRSTNLKFIVESILQLIRTNSYVRDKY